MSTIPIDTPRTVRTGSSSSSSTDTAPNTSTATAAVPTLPPIAAVVKEHAKRELVRVLNTIPGKKGLVIDPSLSGPLSLVAEFALLKENAVEKIYHLQPGKLHTECTHIVYIVRPTIEYIEIIRDHLQAARESKTTSYDTTIAFVPRRTTLSERILEDLGIYGDVTIQDFQWDFVPLEQDLLSLELGDSVYKDLFIDNDTSCLFHLAKAIMKLQVSFGLVPKLIGKGEMAQRLVELLVRMRKEIEAKTPLSQPVSDDWFVPEESVSSIFPDVSEFEAMVIVDRRMDMVSPMLTQLTYEGLLDEVFGLNSTFIEVDAALVTPSADSTASPSSSSSAPSTPSPSIKAPPTILSLPATTVTAPSTNLPHSSSSSSSLNNTPSAPIRPTLKKKLPLNSTSDKIFSTLRDKNFATTGPTLHSLAKKISAEYSSRHHLKTISELKGFVKNLGGLQSEHLNLKLHTALAEAMMGVTSEHEFHVLLEVQQNLVAGIINPLHISHIEDMIHVQTPLWTILRLLCLYSLINNGFKPKQYDFFRTEILQTYGYQYLVLLHVLRKGRLFFPTSDNNSNMRYEGSFEPSYAAVMKSLQLISDENDERVPRDIGYVYSGYAPVLVRIVNELGRFGYRAGGMRDGERVDGGKAFAGVVGETGLVCQRVENEGDVRGKTGRVSGNNSSKSGNERLPVLVVVLGGVTAAEVSALRFLSRKKSGDDGGGGVEGRPVVVLTTNVLTGTKLIVGLEEKIGKM